MPQQPSSDRLKSIARFDDMLGLDACLSQPMPTALDFIGASDAMRNNMWLVIDRNRPVMSVRLQVLNACEAECHRIGMAVAGHG
jgi:hypothetical protein